MKFLPRVCDPSLFSRLPGTQFPVSMIHSGSSRLGIRQFDIVGSVLQGMVLDILGLSIFCSVLQGLGVFSFGIFKLFLSTTEEIMYRKTTTYDIDMKLVFPCEHINA